MADQTCTITLHDTKSPTLEITASGWRDVDGQVYLDPALQDALVAFIDTLCDGSDLVMWTNAQPDWRERESTRVQ